MKRKNIKVLLLSMVVTTSMLAGCGNTASQTVDVVQSEVVQSEVVQSEVVQSEVVQESTEVTAQEEAMITTETTTETEVDNEAIAEQLLIDLEGTYQELWPVVLTDEYQQLWLDDSATIVGEENAQAAVDKMTSMVTGTVIGEEAVKAYADGNMAYDCEFTQGVAQFTFAGNTITGLDEQGKEIFSHTYHYVGMEEIRGLYEYESDDADAGEFTYFCLAPDTMETTAHIEFRYGSNLEALGQYDDGAYAYWLASGIATDYTKEDVENSIELFCTENLAQ